MELVFRTIGVWPGAMTKDRKRASFRSNYAATLKLLDRELRHLRAHHVVLQLALSEDDIRLDGRPRGDAKPWHPGVILTFESRFGPLTYPCDCFGDWRDNLRAIALGLEHLRAVDRYGITQRGEQYTGWKALPAPTGAKMTRDQAALLIVRLGGTGSSVDTILSHEEARRNAYRAAAYQNHPDRGGDPEKFRQLQEAKEVLGL